MKTILAVTTAAILITGCSEAPEDKTKSINTTIKLTSLSSLSSYETSKEIINPVYGNVPVKGESRNDPSTGVMITRMTDVTELDGTDDALIVYSRYTPESTDGKFFLVFGTNSATCWLIERATGDVIVKLTVESGGTLGELSEIRWDLSGNYPHRLYYRDGMKFSHLDIASTTDPDTDETSYEFNHTLIKDFTSFSPNSTLIYNDVEGDSSNDSDHWAWMAAHYDHDSGQFLVDAYVHYQISTNKTHVMVPADLAGSNLDAEKDKATFTHRPNMVEVSPLGNGIVIHHGRKWDDSSYGGDGADWMGTWYDGAYLWPLDFDYTTQPPIRISIGASHSGWSYDAAGREMFVSQNNRTDKLDAIYVEGPASGYDNRTEVADHGDFGWSNGFHYGKLPLSKKGWAFINTYSHTEHSDHASDWGADQLIMIQMKAETKNPTVWRIAPNYNIFTGEYRDEAIAAINTQGNRIYITSNWGGALSNREVFLFELPSNWDSILK